ncbi:MAG: metal-sensitive transcriptional regulator, partial [Chloroflexota bacterium]|nr:metal-sensitive transcriptional regulator [Chloroflexota bacterium]
FRAVPAAAVPPVLVELANPYQAGGLKEILMINSTDPQSKENIKHRLSRIEGQLRGVQKMIDADRDCREILQQLIAIRAGVQSASLSFMQDVARDCLLNAEVQADPEAQRALMVDLIQMLGKVS